MSESTAPAESWQPTACVLCSRNCGLEVVVEAGHLTRIRGDKAHPLSRGYICQKATRLDHYQNHADRLSSPLRRRPDGSLEEVSWDVAIAEIAGRIRRIREEHGGRALAYYGGGQGTTSAASTAAASSTRWGRATTTRRSRRRRRGPSG